MRDDVDLTDLDRFAEGFPHHVFDALRRESPVWFHPPTAHSPGGFPLLRSAVGIWVMVATSSRTWVSLARSRSARQCRARTPFIAAHRVVDVVAGSRWGLMVPSAMPSLMAAASLAFWCSTRSATRASASGSLGGSASIRNWWGRSAANRAYAPPALRILSNGCRGLRRRRPCIGGSPRMRAGLRRSAARTAVACFRQ
jgi:hypothetical protein